MGSVYEGCSEDLCIFFSSIRDTLFLHYDNKPCTYDVIYMIRLLLQFFHLSLHVLLLFFFFFILFMHMILIYCMQTFMSVSH